MTMKLFGKTAEPDVSQFTDLVREAVAADREWRRLSEPSARRLSRDAYLKTADQYAETTPGVLEDLRRRLQESPERFPATLGFIRRLDRELLERSAAPPRDSRRFGPYGLEAAMPELVALGATPMHAVALAAEDRIRRMPEWFGECEDLEAHHRRVAEVKARRDALFERIGREWTPADILVGNVRPDGYAFIAFTLSGGAVPVAPLENAGERLIQWLQESPKALEALEAGGENRWRS